MRRVAAGLALLLATGSSVARAQRSLEIQAFDSRITIEPNSTLDIEETIRVHFSGSWNGIYRKVPLEYRTPQGFNWSIRLDLVGATDDEGNALKTESSREAHFLKYKMWVPGATDVTRTIRLHYRARGALRYFEDHDELYWNVTGDEWDVALGDVTAVIRLPAGARGVRATAFNGVYGSTAREAQVEVSADSVRITMPRKLEFREGMTAVVGWDKGLVAAPSTGERIGAFLASNWPLLIPFPVLIGMVLLWWRRGRDPRRLPVTVRYEPPQGLTPAEAGTITDESADMRDITATVVDLAVRGFLKIEEREDAQLLGLFKHREFIFHRLRPPAEWSDLQEHEQKVLEGIFDGSAETVELSALKNEFYKSLTGIKSGIMDRLVSLGYYRRRPDNVRSGWMGLGVALGAVIAIGGAALSARLSLTPVPFFVAGIAVALIILIIGYQMPARTIAGARTLEQVLGFAEFLERVDKDRFERVVRTPEMFERFLPFAMAFGVEQKWAQAFRDIYTTPPTWYVGSNFQTFNVARFSSSLSEMSTRAGSVMSSAPRSSSGSGFSGGSSGGGGGGGGGGGF